MTAPFFAPVALSYSFWSGERASRIWMAAFATESSSRGVSWRSFRIAAFRTSSRIFLESSVVILLATSTKRPPTSLRASSSGGSPCSSAQDDEPACPELIVLVEVALLALREEVAAPGEPVLERGERLVAVDMDPLGLGSHLVLEVGEILGRASRRRPR